MQDVYGIEGESNISGCSKMIYIQQNGKSYHQVRALLLLPREKDFSGNYLRNIHEDYRHIPCK